MSDYLPDVYLRFRELYPQVAETLDGLGAATESAGPLDRRTQRLVKLATPDEVRPVALLAITTTGFPTAVASLGWIEDVLPSA